jgi:peptidyl-prolyl cis-trans isomerase B (cyclophilin B)
MAHAGRDTGGSQFFIVLNEDNCHHLNGVHTVFGRVTEGLDVVRQLQKGDKMEKVEITEGAAS